MERFLWQTSYLSFFYNCAFPEWNNRFLSNQRSSKMNDFVSYFNKTTRTQWKTLINKINQVSSQIRRGKMPVNIQLRSRCSSFELNQPYLHEPTHNMIDFLAILTVNTDGINQWWNSLIIILHMISWYHALDKNMIVKYFFLAMFITNPSLWILFWYFRASNKDWKKLY